MKPTMPKEEIGTFDGVTYTADDPRIPCTETDCGSKIPHYIMGYPGELARAMRTHDPARCPCSACYVRRGGHPQNRPIVLALKRIAKTLENMIETMEGKGYRG